nr:phosphatase PAP2 family protein [Prauserella flavalba]
MPPRHVPLLAAACAVFTLVLGLPFAGERSPGAFDAAVERGVESAFGHGLLTAFVLPSEFPVVLTALAVLAAVAAVRGRWGLVALVVAAPTVAISVNTWMLKPAFGRYYDDHLAYPSGHTVSLVTVLTLLALLAAPGARRLAAVVVGALLTALAGTGMVGLGYHYLTDVAGGAAFAVAVTLGLASAGAASARHRRRRGVASERREPADGA